MSETVDSLSTYYANLLILQYLSKPRAYAHVKALVTPMLMDLVPQAVQDAFDLDTATGFALDIIGKYIGAYRTNKGSVSTLTLNDTDFRTLIILIGLKNNSDSGLATIEELLVNNFPNLIHVSDNQTMQLSYTVAQAVGSSDLLDIIVTGGLLPKPMGVGISITVVPSLSFVFYGWRTYSTPAPASVAGFNSYQFPTTSAKWVNYEGAY